MSSSSTNSLQPATMSIETVNGQRSSAKKRDRAYLDYELSKESLEESYQLEAAIIRLHLTGSRRASSLERLKREHVERLKGLELPHPTAMNPIQPDTESFLEKGDRHFFEGNPSLDNSFDALDSSCQSTDANGRRCVHEAEKSGSEVSQTKATQPQSSESSRKVSSLHPGEIDEEANSRTTSRSAEEASAAEVELDGGASSTRSNQGDVLIGNTSVEEIDLGKEITGEAEKDTANGLIPPFPSREGAEEMTSRDILTSRASAADVFPETARAAVMEKGSPPSKAAPHYRSACASVEVSQSRGFDKASADYSGIPGCHPIEDQKCDVSEVLVSPEPARSALGNISSSRCLEGLVSENPASDAYEGTQIRDACREGTSGSDFSSNLAPGSSPELPPMPANKDGSGEDQEQQNELQEADPEGPNSLNCTSSDRRANQMQPVVLPQICEDAFPPVGLQKIALADVVNIQSHQDALLFPQFEIGNHAAPDSHMATTQTSLHPGTCSAIDSLSAAGGHVGSQLLSIVPPQPLGQGRAERPFPDPLENELEKIQRELVHNDQIYADLNLRLKSEMDREIARVRAKYDLDLKEAEAAHKLKNNYLDTYKDCVYMNSKLAEAFRMIATALPLRQADAPANPHRRSFDASSSAGSSEALPLSASSRSHLPSNPSPSRVATLNRPKNTHPALLPVNPAWSHGSSIADIVSLSDDDN